MEIIFNFLAKSISESLDMDRSLTEFMKSIFGHEKQFNYLLPQVQLKHVTHVWFTLRLAQAGRLINQNQVIGSCSGWFERNFSLSHIFGAGWLSVMKFTPHNSNMLSSRIWVFNFIWQRLLCQWQLCFETYRPMIQSCTMCKAKQLQ